MTTEEWILRSQAADDPAEARRCLDEAAAAAQGIYDLRQLLSAELALGERQRIAAVLEQLLEAAQIEGEAWAFVDVAMARAEALADPEGAARALEQAEPLLAQDEVSASWGWCHLAGAWLHTLGRPEQARYCLQRAEEAAADPADLCTVAQHCRELLGDEGLERAKALVARAEAAASEHDAWTLANTWHALSEPEAAARVLHEALGRATQSDAALTIARAWEEHGQSDQAKEALERAAALARSAEDWLELARLQHEMDQEQAAVAASLQAALAAAADDEELREQIEEASERWLGGAL